MMQSITLAYTDTDSPHLAMPDPTAILGAPDSLPNRLVRPLLQLEGGLIRPELKGLPLCVFAHEVGIDELVWRIDADGRYILRRYNTLSLPPSAKGIRATLDAYIEDEYDSIEDFEDEMEEVFDSASTPRGLAPAESGRIAIETGRVEWIQNTTRKAPYRLKTFAFALCSHPQLFGRYYIFVSPTQRTVRQVFQCT
jgi:hypothetical protein